MHGYKINYSLKLIIIISKNPLMWAEQKHNQCKWTIDLQNMEIEAEDIVVTASEEKQPIRFRNKNQV